MGIATLNPSYVDSIPFKRKLSVKHCGTKGHKSCGNYVFQSDDLHDYLFPYLGLIKIKSYGITTTQSLQLQIKHQLET